MKPDEIEKRSFKIIDNEAGDHGFPHDQWTIVRRMIHTTADFDYIRTVRFHPEAIRAGIRAIRQGQNIVTDTEMVRAGIRKADLESFGVKVFCFLYDPGVIRLSLETGITRAAAAAVHGALFATDGIYTIGNAPTALLRLTDLLEQGVARPALVIGLPVGFVNAAESKTALLNVGVPFISNLGRKGGSNVAASVVNALIKLAIEEAT